jgi:DNA-binding CsgD family transcriptional regulator
MNKGITKAIVLFLLLLCYPVNAFSDNSGHISGTLILDDSWDTRIYVSLVETFEREYTISNNLIVASAEIDSLGNFQIDLDKVSSNWSLLRLHIVKKGVSPNSLVIGSKDENYFFIIAKRDSEIRLYNNSDIPIFKTTRVEGAPYMETFEYIRKLSSYPNSIDYENSLIEKEFIKEVVSEKLKVVADSCTNPLVSLYALYQTDFQSDYLQDSAFYDHYISKWDNEKSAYFTSFASKFSNQKKPVSSIGYLIALVGIACLFITALLLFIKRSKKINKLSVQERKVFDLIRQGLTNKEISTACNVELTTVKSHVSKIYSKLNIKSRREAINLKIKSH